MRACLNCGEEMEGRSDKKFCNPYCKSSFHYEKTKNNESNLYQTIDRQLKRNRRLLKQFNKAGYASLRVDKLDKEGFDANFFTHYWKSKKGEVYLFCYEYGFIKKKINSIDKYILIEWQSYMKK